MNERAAKGDNQIKIVTRKKKRIPAEAMDSPHFYCIDHLCCAITIIIGLLFSVREKLTKCKELMALA